MKSNQSPAPKPKNALMYSKKRFSSNAALASDSVMSTLAPTHKATVGLPVGDELGEEDGDADGERDGDADGLLLGDTEGLAEGDALGLALGLVLGLVDGEMLGDDEGDTLGDADGLALGLVVGATVHSSSSIRNNCRLRGCESIVSTTFSHSASLPSYKDSRCSFSPAGAFT